MNEKLVALIGIVLILLVFLITFFRWEKNNESEKTTTYSSEKTYQYKKISFQEVQNKITLPTGEDEKVLIVDIREKENYQIEHITDSKNIPLNDLAEVDLGLGNYDLIIIVGYGIEEENIEAAKILDQKGIANAAILPGGLLIWKENGGQTVSQGNTESFIDHAKITPISSENLKALLDKKYQFYLLDIRSSESFSEEHIPRANNIPLGDLESRRNEIPLTKEIIVYGSTDLQGFQAGVKLYDMNFFSVWVLDDGFLNWKEKGFAVE